MGALLGGPTTLADTRLLVLSPMSVGLGGGRSLIAYSRVVADSTFGNFQVRFQIVDSTDATAVDGGVAVDAATDSVSGAMDALLDRGPIDAGATTDGAAMDRAVIADAIDDHRAAVDAADAADSGPVAMLGDRSGCSCATAAGGGAGTANQPMLAVGLILAGVAVARVRRRRR
jgi:MYXO-CTERM domain-containing protein